MKVKMILCPQCKKEFNYWESEFRPFCREKCKLIDLGHWLSEEYSISSNTVVEGEGENEEQE